MSKIDVVLIAGTIVEHEVVSGGLSAWKRIPRLTEIGAVGEQSEPKEKTTLEHKIKKYDSGLRDAPDKNLKGQYIPVQDLDSEHFDDRELQQEFIARCRNEDEFNVRVIWPDGDVSAWLHKSLGFEYDQGTQEDWKMFTTNGKQNSRVVYEAALTGTSGISATETSQLTLVTTPLGLDTSGVTMYWTSSDENIATVDENGLVTAIASGSVEISASFRGVVGKLEVVVA